MVQISEVKELGSHLEALSLLLCDCVSAGASIGFVEPLLEQEAKDYWCSIGGDIENGNRCLFIAKEANRLIGTVQLTFCQKKNGLHRAEVEKLMVHTSARGKGIGKMLMETLEKKALDCSRTLLVLDTRKGDVASKLYSSIGFQCAGEIPGYAANSSGGLDSTVYFYKTIKM